MRLQPGIFRHLAKRFNDFDDDPEVLLLIGRDSGECMKTRWFANKPPFAHHTALGWCLVGKSCSSSEADSSPRTSLKINLTDHFSISPTFERISATNQCVDIFARRHDDEKPGLSKDDSLFLHYFEQGVCSDDLGNLVISLPFRTNNPKLPANHIEVFYRTKNTLGRLSKDVKLPQCLQVMGKYITAGHVEEVPS